MSNWRIVEVPEGQELDSDLSDAELVGVSVILTHHSGEPWNDMNVYWRAREKIQPQVRQAIDNQDS